MDCGHICPVANIDRDNQNKKTMKTKRNWPAMVLGLLMIGGLAGCDCIDFDCLVGPGGPSLPDSIYYSEVGIRAEYERARCRKVCMDALADSTVQIILPTGDTIVGPLDTMNTNNFDDCILICNTHSPLSPEFIALDRSHERTASLFKHGFFALSSKMMILTHLPLFALYIAAPSPPPIGDNDCGMYTCLSHVHIIESSDDPILRVLSPVWNDTDTVSVGIENAAGTPLFELITDPEFYEGDEGGYRVSRIGWDSFDYNSYNETSLLLRVTRKTVSGSRNISRTPLFLHLLPTP